ncbi:ATP-binding protein [Halobium salinum]|uniref:ATP-binding protein n=1 Tax=Halobium salinum TaxID=1364940 RepID=A0ABD5PBN1_9EURY|nr:adenine nucleotide alpha hydrolase [Halobium salinum]
MTESEPTAESTPTVLSWSGGKDAAVALEALRDDPAVRVTGLLTTVSAATDRTTMHGVRPELIEAQADALSLPLRTVELPADPSNDEYEARMRAVHDELAGEGVERVAFGDLYLEDVRAYRESNLADAALDGVWPLWGRDTGELAREFVDRGFRAIVVCVDGSVLDASFVGREYDASLLADLPDGVDPCAENGEFHTFVVGGPGFDSAVGVERGETVTRDVQGSAFHYQDLLAR